MRLKCASLAWFVTASISPCLAQGEAPSDATFGANRGFGSGCRECGADEGYVEPAAGKRGGEESAGLLTV
jgi:hypothetical protein